MADDMLYDQDQVPDNGGGNDPGDPLGIKRKLQITQQAPSLSVDPLGIRSKLSEASQPRAFQIQISQPSFKSTPVTLPARSFTGSEESTPSGQFSSAGAVDEYGMEKLRKKASDAKAKLDTELLGNDAEYEKKMREYRRDAFTMQDLMKEAKDKGYIIPVGKEKEYLQLAKQRQHDLPVTKEDISDIKTGTILNTAGSRNFIRDLNNADVQKSAYLVDAYNHASQDLDGIKRVPKIIHNAEKISKNEYEYDPVNKVLVKPEGFLKSLFTGRDDLNNALDFYDYVKSKPEASVIDKLNHEIIGDIDEPVPVPSGRVAGIGRMMGSQPIKGLLLGGAAAAGTTLAGNPEVSPTAFNLTNAGVSAYDMYRIGYAGAIRANYRAFKNQGLSDQEALQKSKSLAEDQANVDAATAAFMSLAAGKMAFKPTEVAAGAIRKSLGTALTQMGETATKKSIEGLGVGVIGGIGQVVKNVQAQNAGLPVHTGEGVKDQIETGVLLTAATHVVAKGAKTLKPSTLRNLTHALSNVPKENIDADLAAQQEGGHITSDEAKRAQDLINQARVINELIPADLPETDRLKIGAKMRERNLLKEKIDKVDEAYHPEIKEDIKKLNEEIINLSKGSERGDLQKLVHKEIGSGNVHGFATDVLRHASESDLNKYMINIAEQANDPSTAQTTLDTFGKNIVEKAKQMHEAQMAESAVPESEEQQAENNIQKNKTEQNASTIRSDEGQVQIGGTNPESGQEQSGSNIQLQESAAPVNAETEQQAGGGYEGQAQGNDEGEKVNSMEGGIPPNMHDLPFTPEEGDVGRLAHQDTEKIYRELGMSDRIPRATKDDISLEREADNLIRDGYDFEGKADRVLAGHDKSFSDAEQVAFAKMVGSLNVKLMNMEVNTPEFDATLNQIEKLSRASDVVGSEEGASFRARRMFVLNDETLSSFFDQAKKANLDVPLDEEQKADVKERFDQLRKAKDAYQGRVAELEAENAKLKAGEKIKEIPAKKEAGKDYKAERKEILDSISDKWNKYKGNTQATIVPYADFLVKIAPDVMKLVANLVSEGVDKLPDIVKSVHEQLTKHVPQITEKDVHDIIAGEYSKKVTKSELQEKLENVRIQAKLINRLEALEAGIQPKNARQKLVRSAEIEKLRTQIKDFEREKSEAAKQPKTKQTPEQSALQALKARYKKQTEDIQRKIDAGDFEPEEKKELKLDKEAQDLKDAYIQKKIEWKRHVAEEAYKNRTTGEKARDKAIEVLNIPRTVMASADLSAPLRQGLVLTASHPSTALKAFVESIKQAIDPKRFDRWLYDLKESDYYKNVIEKSGLYVADPNNLHLAAKEEQFMTNLAEKIPIIGDTLKTKSGKTIIPGAGLIGRSEKAYVAYLNKLRVDVFTQYAKSFADQGITPETRPDVYEALGRFVNAATGRGELGALEKAAPVLNTLLFSPRLIASRLNMLNPLWYAKLPKPVRMMALRDMGMMVGAGVMTVGLFSLIPGVKTELNPDSPDFGKIHYGNTRWDVWGGFQQYVRIVSQMLSGYEKKSNGNVVPLGSERNEHSRAEKLESFFRGKLAPVPSIAYDFLSGKTAVGEPVTIPGEIREHFIPMIGNDIADAWKEQGPMSLLYTGVPSLLGVGLTTYEPKENQSSGGRGDKKTRPSHLHHIKKS